jgi:hypothetical protein
MNNPWCHHIDCDYWHDHYPNECTCASRLGSKPPDADPTQELRAIRIEIADLRKRLSELEARAALISAVHSD